MKSFSKGIPQVFVDLAKKYGKTYGLYSFTQPVLVVGDPDMLKLIMVKNFSHFHNRVYFAQNNKELQSSVAALEDERWREVRNLLTPTFSAAKMKQMSPLVNESADKMVMNITTMQEKKGCIECREIFGAFVMDTIGSCAFGLNIDSQANPNDPFVAHAKRAFSFSTNNPLFIIGAMFPPLGRLLGYLQIGLFLPKDVVAFFRDVTMKAVALRKKLSRDSQNKMIDFLQLMIDAQNPIKRSEEDQTELTNQQDMHAENERHHNVEFHAKKLEKSVQLTNTELVAQAVTFFTAGYETTNTLLGFVFYLLSTHPEIQEKLIREVDNLTPSRDSVGYSSISTMPYLDQVVNETLRIYPPAPILSRQCNETFTYNGITVEKGVKIFIPNYAIHHDEDYWPNPSVFDPERFSKAAREKQHPFAWLPFGAGPHNCIGMRFALMEAKMAIARVLQKFRFETCPETENPPKCGTNGLLSPPNGITLRAIPRTDIVQ